MVANLLQYLYEEMDILEQCNYYIISGAIISTSLSPLWTLLSLVGVCSLSMFLIIFGNRHFTTPHIIKDKHRTKMRTMLEFLLLWFSYVSLICLAMITFTDFSRKTLSNWGADQNMTWREIAECNSVTVKSIIFQALPMAVDVTFIMWSTCYVGLYSSHYIKLCLPGDETKDHEEPRVQVLQCYTIILCLIFIVMDQLTVKGHEP